MDTDGTVVPADACVWRNPGNTWHLEHGQVIPDIQKAGHAWLYQRNADS